VERDMASGRASGVTGTPTLFVNGTRHGDAIDLRLLRMTILDAAARAREVASARLDHPGIREAVSGIRAV
jgi:hypothetical protein